MRLISAIGMDLKEICGWSFTY